MLIISKLSCISHFFAKRGLFQVFIGKWALSPIRAGHGHYVTFRVGVVIFQFAFWSFSFFDLHSGSFFDLHSDNFFQLTICIFQFAFEQEKAASNLPAA